MINKNRYGTEMKIVAYRSHSDIDVQFLDEVGYIKEHCAYINFKNGVMKNPYDKTIHGVGCIGVGNHKTKKNGHTDDIYSIWTSLLDRCYNNFKKYPAGYKRGK